MGIFRRDETMIGIDIGSASVKAAVVDHATDTPRLLRLVSAPMPPEAIREGEVADREAVIDALRRLVEQFHAPMERVTVAVGGRDVVVRKIGIEPAAESDLPEVIRWEAESVVPFEMRDVHLAWQRLETGTDEKTDILLVAARKELVKQRLELLSEAGIHASIVDVDVFGLFNAFEHNYPSATDSLMALINVGHETATIVVCEEGVPVGGRDVPFGSRQLAREPGDEGADPGAELGLAVERTIASVVDARSARRASSVFLSGGAARTPRLGDAVARYLGTHVEVVTPFQRLDVAPEVLARLGDDDQAPRWMLPVGLALRSPAKPRRKPASGER
jgi:type IV pilus assembly protein PilM